VIDGCVVWLVEAVINGCVVHLCTCLCRVARDAAIDGCVVWLVEAVINGCVVRLRSMAVSCGL
jgi:hypothetical protein